MNDAPPPGRWRLLAVLAAAVLLSLVPWFSAASVAPLIAGEWSIGGLETALLTVAVQLGFAVGALVVAVSGAADVVPANRLIAVGALLASAGNAAFGLFATDLATALPLRALSGFGIAAVYPVAMKVLAGWFARERGLAVGVLIGAITLGSAAPHAIRAAGGLIGLDWRSVVLAASFSGVVAAALAWRGVRDGPLNVPAARFSARMAREALRQPSVRLANLGYLGHMWELYAMWTWVPLFLAASLAAGGVDAQGASLAAFVVVAAGAVGCVVAGLLADRLGRTTLTIAAMALSGTSAVVAGVLFGAPPLVVLAVVVVWGVTVVADSAQFSTAISELSPPGTAGSALALQTSAGFLLTGLTIVGVGLLDPAASGSWGIAFAMLAIGPLVGIAAMWRLRLRPDAVRMASGRR